MDGRVEAIAAESQPGAPKSGLGEARLLAGQGIQGDACADIDHRQLSIVDHAALRARGADGCFSENLVLSGLDLGSLGLGSRLRLGGTALVSLTQIAGCLFARVVQSGRVRVGDPAVIEHAVARSVVQAVVLTVSDRCAAGTAEDTTGPAVAQLLRESLAAHLYATEIVPDGRTTVAERLRHYADGPGVDLVVAAGGTGPAPQDQTPEAVRDVVERLTPGFDEAMRMASLAKTPMAMLSRACSGIRGATLIVSLPGSERAAVENLQAILPALPHCLTKLRGDPSDCGRPSP